MRPLQLRTSLTVRFTAILAALVTGLALATHFALVRQLDANATARLEEMARALHGYLRFDDGEARLAYDPEDPDTVAFIDDATDYYQVYNATTGQLLTQSDALNSLGLRYTPAEVEQFRAAPGFRDVETDRGRLRLYTSDLRPAPGQEYLVEVGEMLRTEDRAIAAFDQFLFWRVLIGLAFAALAGRWLAGRALVPLREFAHATTAIDITNLDARLALRGTRDELDQVAGAFNQALERVSQSVGEMRQFSAAIAHELRTPLAILRGEAELALRPASTDDERRQALSRQIEECDRLTRLITQILTLARAESGEIPMARDRVDLVAIASTVAEQLQLVAEAKDLTLSWEASDPLTVVGDAGWLERLVLILLDNAIRFTPKGGRVTISFSHSPATAQLMVHDSGIGIPADAIPHLFERFYQVAPGRTRDSGGAGLGLALAKWITDRHGASIAVVSEPGKGSTFTVTLPRS